jgi:hypothetical protein
MTPEGSAPKRWTIHRYTNYMEECIYAPQPCPYPDAPHYVVVPESALREAEALLEAILIQDSLTQDEALEKYAALKAKL